MMGKKNKRGNAMGYSQSDWMPADLGAREPHWRDPGRPNPPSVRRQNYGPQGRWNRESDWYHRGYDDFFGPHIYNNNYGMPPQNDPNYWLKEQIRQREMQLAEIMERQSQLISQTRGAIGLSPPPPLMSLDVRKPRFGRHNYDRSGWKPNRSAPPQQSKRVYCEVCRSNIDGSFKTHCRSTTHKREVQVKRGCGWCGIDSFKSFTELREHRMTQGHVEKQEKYGKKKGEKEKEITDPNDMPAYEPGCVRGQKYVMPVTGFYCKLCKKFFREELAATVDHCSSEGHYEKWKEAKLMSLRDRKNAKIKNQANGEDQKEEDDNQKDASDDKKEEGGSDDQKKTENDDHKEDADASTTEDEVSKDKEESTESQQTGPESDDTSDDSQ